MDMGEAHTTVRRLQGQGPIVLPHHAGWALDWLCRLMPRVWDSNKVGSRIAVNV